LIDEEGLKFITSLSVFICVLCGWTAFGNGKLMEHFSDTVDQRRKRRWNKPCPDL
jgi:hypothetical protein